MTVSAGDPDWAGTGAVDVSQSPLDLAWQPVLAAGMSGRMVVAWSDQRSDAESRSVYSVISDDNGRSWSAPDVVSSSIQSSRFPDVVLAGDRVFLAWLSGSGPPYELFEKELGSQTARHILSRQERPLTETAPRMCVQGGKLHVVFNGGRYNIPDILYASRPLTAASWPTGTVIITHTAAHGSWNPALAADPDGETLHLVWEEYTSSTRRTIMYARGAEELGSMAWTPPIVLSGGITLSLQPAIEADTLGNLHVVWTEQVGAGSQRKQYVRYRRYDVDTGSWMANSARIDPQPVRVNSLNPTDVAPDLVSLGTDVETVCVAWHGFREQEMEWDAEEVIVSCTRDGGQSWPVPRNVSRTPGETGILTNPISRLH